jgi:DNA polymerase III subunit epsilon
MILAMDLETTGIPLWKDPSQHPDQPHIVQFSARLIDDETRTVVTQWDMVIKPNGWTIPKEMTEIHGITTEKALEVGVNEGIAVEIYLMAWKKAGFLLGFNPAFDRRIMRIAMLRHGMTRPAIEAVEKKRVIDVMHICTSLCQIPPSDAMMATGRRTFKTPNLGQAVQMLLGRRHIGAHNAIDDLDATLELYWLTQDLKRRTTIDERPTATNDGAADAR